MENKYKLNELINFFENKYKEHKYISITNANNNLKEILKNNNIDDLFVVEYDDCDVINLYEFVDKFYDEIMNQFINNLKSLLEHIK